jgi:hypothetical protein
MTTPKRYELEDAQWDRIKGYFPPTGLAVHQA